MRPLPATLAFVFLSALTTIAILLVAFLPADKFEPWTHQVEDLRPGLRQWRLEQQHIKTSEDTAGDKNKVPFEVHIMSKCPDAKECMELLVFPALEEVKDIVDFKMSFIGKTNSDDGGVTCMHGPSECLGNTLHLCAERLYPLDTSDHDSLSDDDTTTFIPFSKCLFHKYSELPNQTFIKHCSKKGGLEFEKLNQCVSDTGEDGGVEMLRASVERSAAAGVKTSCTVRIGGRTRCVRDGEKWKECEGGSGVKDLVRDIKREYGDVLFEDNYGGCRLL
ncbi:hypothetical protein BDZ91DRAFT_654382 [Kalaharituber pfeilii]|nr:hypothetical protein BDZ91DRAFT_654382 [Kalaharituber pfeilii]